MITNYAWCAEQGKGCHTLHTGPHVACSSPFHRPRAHKQLHHKVSECMDLMLPSWSRTQHQCSSAGTKLYCFRFNICSDTRHIQTDTRLTASIPRQPE